MSEIVQGTPEWHAARLGRVTASRVADVVAKIKSGWGASRANYMAELICERLTGTSAESYINGAMQWGLDTEPQAKAAYSFLYDIEIAPIGFVQHPTIPDSGASPDGLIGDDGLVEIKCPNTATHIESVLSQVVPEKYITQMQWQMACTGRAWCNFVSFDPRLPPSMQMFIHRIDRDDKRIAELEQHVRDFLDEMSKKIAELIKITEGRKAA